MTPPNPPDVPALIQRAEQLRADIARASQMTDSADAANCALEASNVIAGLLALLTARETAPQPETFNPAFQTISVDECFKLQAKVTALEAALVTAQQERDDEIQAGDLHRDLNRRTAIALGKPFEGANSSWRDIPDQVEALRADRDALRDQVAQLQQKLGTSPHQ